eukprot:748093-Alexandrium_andersonii.AAC.1
MIVCYCRVRWFQPLWVQGGIATKEEAPMSDEHVRTSHERRMCVEVVLPSFSRGGLLIRTWSPTALAANSR